MVSLYPLTFGPIFKERVWGGRSLERLFHKPLPPGQVIGESWEITDRPEGVSVVANGPLAGMTLRWLMENHAAELLGPAHAACRSFPLLVKILDAREKLSLQVHPPA
ncbi:MAG TPA: mannose-6-phosphate isomerase, partial [Verrucomicrobiales bacterium]|nr:mannose-6-phosphate isomerase [Verrucomicrobiales bacterium]